MGQHSSHLVLEIFGNLAHSSSHIKRLDTTRSRHAQSWLKLNSFMEVICSKVLWSFIPHYLLSKWTYYMHKRWQVRRHSELSLSSENLWYMAPLEIHLWTNSLQCERLKTTSEGVKASQWNRDIPRLNSTQICTMLGGLHGEAVGLRDAGCRKEGRRWPRVFWASCWAHIGQTLN